MLSCSNAAAFASGNTFIFETGATIDDPQGGNTLVACDPFDFDRSQAPANGC